MLAVGAAVQAGLLPRAVWTGMGLGIYGLMAITAAVLAIMMPRSDARMWGIPLRWAIIVFAVLKTRAELG